MKVHKFTDIIHVICVGLVVYACLLRRAHFEKCSSFASVSSHGDCWLCCLNMKSALKLKPDGSLYPKCNFYYLPEEGATAAFLGL